MAGPIFWRIAFRIFVVVVGFLILSGAINASIIGATRAPMRVAEDGVLTDWFRKPHTEYGTSYRIVNLVFALQMITIIASRGTSSCSARPMPSASSGRSPLTASLCWCCDGNIMGERGRRVPPNIRIGKTEIPSLLISVFLVLLCDAAVNLFTKSVATISGISFSHRCSSSSSLSPSASTCEGTPSPPPR